jgi:hypothetical protein
MKGGDTFRPTDASIDTYRHLWVIVSDPDQDPEKVVIVSITEAHPKKDTACILQPHDHPFLYKESCVAYDLANLVSVADLILARDNGDLEPREPIDPAVLERIRKRSSFSKRMDPDLYDILDRQGLT